MLGEGKNDGYGNKGDLYLVVKLKDKVWVIIAVWLLDFFLWFGRVVSPHAITRYFLNEFAFDNLSVLISKALVEVCGKELAYIYYQKSTLNEKQESNEVA